MIRIANAPCSWGVIENTGTDGERSGYEKVINEMSAAGYAGTELGDWGFMPTDPELLRAELATRDLQLLASWVTIRLYDRDSHDRGVADAVRTARLLAEVAGPEAIIVIGPDHSTVPLRHDKAGRVKPEYSLDEAGWQIYTEGATRVAQAVRDETGLRSVIHHHGSTYIEAPWEIDAFLERTEPDLIGLCFDTGHYALGGGDPVEGVRRYANRIWHVHFKDFDPSIVARAEEKGWGYHQLIAHGVFSELGKGVVDFPAVYQELQAIGYDGWIVVEQDILPGMGTPRESAERNRMYLQRIGL